jgi:hypothetical protein
MLTDGILCLMKEETKMLDLCFLALGLGLLGLMAAYLTLLRKA